MESLLRFLPRRSLPLYVRYGTTLAIVGVACLLFAGLRGTTRFDGLFLLYPAIFLSAMLFDRGSGFLATGLSTAFVYFRLRDPDGEYFPPDLLLLLTTFVLLGIALATLSEVMRKGWERAVAAEKAKDLLLQELGHRTKNNLAMVTSMLSLQARSIGEPQAKAALENAMTRVHVIASAYEYLRPQDQQARIEMHQYLQELCKRLGDTLRDIRPIAILVEADHHELRSDRAVAVGLIVNELVTNAFKYAFPGDRSGTVRVALTGHSPMTLTVEDDGVGCPDQRTEGTGSRLIRLLVLQLDGTIARTPANPGCSVAVVINN